MVGLLCWISILAKPYCQGFNNYNDKVTIVFTDDKVGEKYTISDVNLIPVWRGKKYKAIATSITINKGVATVTLTFNHFTKFSNPKVELKINGKKTTFKVCQ